MCKFRKSAFIGAVCLSQLAYSMTSTVQNGETLSQIAYREFPNERVYGADGSLARLIQLNPEITDPNAIYPNQVIKLAIQIPSLIDHSPTEPYEKKPEALPAKRTSNGHHHDETRVSTGIGGQYYSLTQTGVLGPVDLSLFILNAFELRQKSQINQFIFQTKIRSSEIEIESTNSSVQSRRLSTLDLDLIYKNFSVGLKVHQQPLIRRTGATVDYETQMPFSLELGHYYVLQRSNFSSVTIETQFSYLIKNSSGKSDIIFDKTSGLGVTAELLYERKFKNSNWGFALPVVFSYYSNKADLTWGSDTGAVQTKELSLSSFLSINYGF